MKCGSCGFGSRRSRRGKSKGIRKVGKKSRRSPKARKIKYAKNSISLNKRKLGRNFGVDLDYFGTKVPMVRASSWWYPN